MAKVTDVVSWVMEDDKILKLKKADEAYDISEKLFDSLKKDNLLDKLEDQEVRVKIDGKEITDLQLVNKKSDTNEETKTGTEDTGGKDNIIKELTVHGVSVAKRGVKFKEEDVWYTLEETLDVQVFKDTCTGRVIEAVIAPAEKGNDIITGFTEKEVETKEENTTEPPQQKKQYNNASKSIEAQASLKCAKVIVASMVTPESRPDFVLKLITGIAEHAYKTLQDLKNKE